MSPVETAGLTVAEIVDYVIKLGPTIAASGIWFFGFIMWGQNRSWAAQAAKDAEATRTIMEALKDAAEDRKEMQKRAAEDRKEMQKQAAEDRKEMQRQAAEDRKPISVIAEAALLTAREATKAMTAAAEKQEKTSERQTEVLEAALVTLAKSPDNPRGPAKWGGSSQTDPTG